MSFSGVNYFAVIIAALAGFGLGAVWYMVLSRPWMQAVGMVNDHAKGCFRRNAV